eukprot:COSAG01_NODE_50206_length_365_cov_0.834586_1_plen_62_part_10
MGAPPGALAPAPFHLTDEPIVYLLRVVVVGIRTGIAKTYVNLSQSRVVIMITMTRRWYCDDH